MDLSLKMRTHNSSCLFFFCQCFVSKSCSYLVMSLFNLFQSCPLSEVRFCWFLGFLFPRLDMWVIDISAKGLEFREPFQDCNYLGFISIKGMFWSINSLSWPNRGSSCKSPFGNIKITFINFFLLNNWKNVTKPLVGEKKHLFLTFLIHFLMSYKFKVVFL